MNQKEMLISLVGQLKKVVFNGNEEEAIKAAELILEYIKQINSTSSHA